jgi:hypothetical protein
LEDNDDPDQLEIEDDEEEEEHLSFWISYQPTGLLEYLWMCFVLGFLAPVPSYFCSTTCLKLKLWHNL